MIVGVVQLSCQEDVSENLARATARIAEAASLGAKLVALPENFAFMGEESKKREIAEPLQLGGTTDARARGRGPIADAIAGAAARHGVYVVAGGMPEQSSDPMRPFNTSALFGPDGSLLAAYRKIHLFDVSLADGSEYKESGATTAGADVVTADVGGMRLGMSVCYDVRFPELYRRLADAGVSLVTVPAAFTLLTGKDHWHVLLRARAIENQVYVLAPAQHGKHPRGRQTYGKSLIVDPWGDVLAQCGEGEGVAVARIDVAYQERVRASLPCLGHRRM